MATAAFAAPNMATSQGYLLGAAVVLALLLYAGMPMYPFGGVALTALILGGAKMLRENRPAFGLAGAYAAVLIAGIGIIFTPALH